MTDCIRSLLNSCSHLKDFFVINHIKRYFFQLSPMHFSGEPDLQGQRLKYLSVKRGKGKGENFPMEFSPFPLPRFTERYFNR